MTENNLSRPVASAILTMAAVKNAADTFERGDVNVYDALDAILVAVDAYAGTRQEATRPRRAAA